MMLGAAWMSVALAAASPQQDVAPLLDAELASVVSATGPGCVVGVSRQGRRTFASRGLASVELAVPLTPDSVFDLASNAKQFTAAVVHQLAAEGRLSLEDPIQRHLPDFPTYGRPILIRHLLHHTSGLRDVDSLRQLTRTEDETTATAEDAWLWLVRQKALNFAPGTDFAYSNSGYLVLARIIEAVEGAPFAEALDRRIAIRLGLDRLESRRTYFEVVPDRVTPYYVVSDQPRLAAANWVLGGTGSLWITPRDALTWLEALEAPPTDLDAPLRALFQVGALDTGVPTAYASGLVADVHAGARRFFHNGGFAGYRSTLTVYPDRSLAMAVLCNSGSVLPNRLSDRIAAALLRDEPAHGVEQSLPAAEPGPETAGWWYSDALDAYRWIEPTADGLRVSTLPEESGRLYPWSEGAGEWVDPASGLRLRSRSGELKLDDNLRHFSTFRPLRLSDQTGSLSSLLGDYASDEIDVRISVQQDAEGAFVQIEPMEPFMRASDTVQRRLHMTPDGAAVTSNGWVLRSRDGGMTFSLGRLVRYPLDRVKP